VCILCAGLCQMYPSVMEPESIVTCMRFPWFNNVSTATTMDSTLLRFLSYTTILGG
jgi:hypothetical protein